MDSAEHIFESQRVTEMDLVLLVWTTSTTWDSESRLADLWSWWMKPKRYKPAAPYNCDWTQVVSRSLQHIFALYIEHHMKCCTAEAQLWIETAFLIWRIGRDWNRRDGNTVATPIVSIDIGTTETKRVLYTYGSGSVTSKPSAVYYRSMSKDRNVSRLLVTIAWGWTGMPLNTQGFTWFPMGHVVVKAVSLRFEIYCTDRSWSIYMDSEHVGRSRRTLAMLARSIWVWFEVIHLELGLNNKQQRRYPAYVRLKQSNTRSEMTYQ